MGTGRTSAFDVIVFVYRQTAPVDAPPEALDSPQEELGAQPGGPQRVLPLPRTVHVRGGCIRSPAAAAEPHARVVFNSSPGQAAYVIRG